MKLRRAWIVTAGLALALVAPVVTLAQTPEQDIRRWLDMGKELCGLLGGGGDCRYIDELDPTKRSGTFSGPYQRSDSGTIRVPPAAPRSQQQNGYPPSMPMQLGILVTGPQTATYMRTGVPPRPVQYHVGALGYGAQVIHLVDEYGQRAAVELYYMDPASGDFVMLIPAAATRYEGRFRLMTAGR